MKFGHWVEYTRSPHGDKTAMKVVNSLMSDARATTERRVVRAAGLSGPGKYTKTSHHVNADDGLTTAQLRTHLTPTLQVTERRTHCSHVPQKRERRNDPLIMNFSRPRRSLVHWGLVGILWPGMRYYRSHRVWICTQKLDFIFLIFSLCPILPESFGISLCSTLTCIA